jgi:F-type H+-transporting ATPase subunit a
VSAVENAAALPARRPATPQPAHADGGQPPKSSVKRRLQILAVVYLAGLIALIAIYGFKGHRNNVYQPQNEFKLENWVNLGIFSINKAVLYLLLAAVLTAGTMIWISKRMGLRPVSKVQVAVEEIFHLTRDNITGSSMDERMAAKWFPFIGALFMFIFFSNLVGYVPLPTNTENEINIFGAHIPSFSLYSATANLSIPLVLALTVFISYTFEGVRAKGPIGYLKGLIPAGVKGGMAGHLIILFMAGALAVILGDAWLGWFTLPFGVLLYVFEIGLVAGLQAFIFAILTAIYLGGAVADSH